MKLGIKKTLSWVLSLIMLFSMIPFSALAEEGDGTEPGTPVIDTTVPEENGGDQPQGNENGSQSDTDDPVTPSDPAVNGQGGENGDNNGTVTDPNNNSGDNTGDVTDPNNNSGDNNGDVIDPNNNAGDNSGDVIDPNNNNGDDNGDTTDSNNNGENGDTTDPNGEGGDDPVVPNGTEPGGENGENETPANVTLEKEYAGVTVTVENVPAGTELTLKGASGYEEALSEKEEAYTVLFGIDIGLNVELEAPVKVTLKGEKFAELDPEAKLYHINNQNEAETVGYGYDDKELTVTFSAKEFSPYILIKAEAAENTDPDEPVVGGGDEPIVNGGDEPVVGGDDPAVNGGDEPIVTGGEEPKAETVTITVKAVFEEDETIEEEKPESITVQLVKGEEAEGESVEINAENEWTYLFEELEEGEYTVTAEAPKGYVVVVTGSVEEGFVLTVGKAKFALLANEEPTREIETEYINNGVQRSHSGSGITQNNLSYEWSIKWNNVADGTTVEYWRPEGDSNPERLLFHPSNWDWLGAGVILNFKVNRLSGAEEDASIPAGAVKLVLPPTAFYGWNGSAVGYVDTKLRKNRVKEHTS